MMALNTVSVDESLPISFLSTVRNEHGLEKINIPSEGNCMFDAVAQSMAAAGLSTPTHREVRAAAVAYQEAHINDFIYGVIFGGKYIRSGDVSTWPRMFQRHLTSMTKEGTWGTESELLAIACHYRLSIRILQQASETGVTVLGPYTPDCTDEERQALPQITILFGKNVAEHYWGTGAVNNGPSEPSSPETPFASVTANSSREQSESTAPTEKSPSPVMGKWFASIASAVSNLCRLNPHAWQGMETKGRGGRLGGEQREGGQT
jgi:hypothetical protein